VEHPVPVSIAVHHRAGERTQGPATVVVGIEEFVDAVGSSHATYLAATSCRDILPRHLAATSWRALAEPRAQNIYGERP
jgi:hypothetical protein